MPFEKKSVDTGFVPDNEVLKVVPKLCYEIWKRIKSSRKEASSRKHGNILKLGLEYLLGIKETSLYSVFSC